jgi:hypothetical protein
MKDYLVDSIEIKRCKKTPDNILKLLIPCEKCNKLPFPQYKSFKKQESIYCKTCFLSEQHKIKNLVIPNKFEINMLENVIISCENTTCEKEFNINTLKEMLYHQKTCGKLVSLKEKKLILCKRCESYCSNDKLHDCIVELKKSIKNNNQNIIDEMKAYFEEKINSKIIQINLESINEEIINHSYKLTEIEEKLENIEKNKSKYKLTFKMRLILN